jgi:hypothetical protein
MPRGVSQTAQFLAFRCLRDLPGLIRRGGMGGGAKGVIGVELEITVMVPTLEGKGKTLIVKKFRIKLVFGWGWNKDELEVVGTFFLCFFGWMNNTFRFSVCDRTDLKKKEVIRETLLVMGQGGSQGIFDGLLVEVVRNVGMENLEEDKKPGGHGVIGIGVDRVEAGLIVLIEM